MRLYYIAIIILTLSALGVTKSLQLSFYNILSPIILTLRESSINLKEVGVLISNIEELRKENSNLRKRVLDLETQLNQRAVSTLNNDEKLNLSKLFEESEVLTGKKVLIKKIVYYDPFSSLLILENNTNEVISENSLVLIGDNLVGLVQDSTEKSIQVSLISSNNIMINTNIINNQGFKIKTVLGSESGDSLVINNILSTENVGVGDLVVTSNSNQNIIPDLIVGRLQRLDGISSQTFRKAYLQKNYDLGSKNYVGVLINDKKHYKSNFIYNISIHSSFFC
jgi:cell shape-determining protein MreC